ncbi:flagellar brake protein [Castellaniella sp.]|uniref:flagellar brake protein n=1 Tax=Castellaniella sp. TaxID=1955812 RepID=UPI002AFF56F4|nr:flagellar brake protein [Castellaniella sp.]
MAFAEDDPFAVSQKFEIQSLLQGLLDKHVLVRLDVPGHAVSIISTVLDLDPKKGLVILDNASEDALNRQLLQAPAVRLQGLLNRVMIEFQGPMHPASQGGKPALALEWPTTVRRIQRRESFRMDVPTTRPATCLIRDPGLPEGELSFNLANISAGGLQLIDRTGLLASREVGTFFDDAILSMPDVGVLDVNLRLLRHDQLIQEGGKPPMQLIALRFFNLASNLQITIQQYVSTLERAVLARRWGGD